MEAWEFPTDVPPDLPGFRREIVNRLRRLTTFLRHVVQFDGDGNVVITGDLTAAGGFRQSIDGWYQENVAASQTAVALTRLATTTDNPTGWIALRPGSVTGVFAHSNAARSAGTLTVEVFKNGSGTGLTAVINGSATTFKATTQAKDTDAFVAGDILDCRVTTDSGWLPVTADLRAGFEVET